MRLLLGTLAAALGTLYATQTLCPDTVSRCASARSRVPHSVMDDGQHITLSTTSALPRARLAALGCLRQRPASARAVSTP
jgi:hypothetical protein